MDMHLFGIDANNIKVTSVLEHLNYSVIFTLLVVHTVLSILHLYQLTYLELLEDERVLSVYHLLYFHVDDLNLALEPRH